MDEQDEQTDADNDQGEEKEPKFGKTKEVEEKIPPAQCILDASQRFAEGYSKIS